MTDPGPPPLIVTLALDAAAEERLGAERRALFPAHLNRVPAHVTLFHHLPGEAEAEVLGRLRAEAGATPVHPVRVTEPYPLGRGVAYRLQAPEAAALRARLAAAWEAWLTPQDRQPWRPHVTVQNKVAPEEARATLARIREAWEPWEARGEGLRLWRYRGGPWEAAGAAPFALAP
jgi:hypothetical protein